MYACNGEAHFLVRRQCRRVSAIVWVVFIAIFMLKADEERQTMLMRGAEALTARESLLMLLIIGYSYLHYEIIGGKSWK